MLVIGLLLMLFLQYLIKGDVPDGLNVYIIYFIFLINLVLSYFLYAYKGSILIADQRSDISNNISSIVSIFTYFTQIVVIYFTNNYYIYCLVFTASTVLTNLIVNLIVNKRYPQFKCYGKISKQELSDINKRIAGLFVYKICHVFRDGIDAIFISAFIGLSILGKYNNYIYILTTITGVLALICQNITASIGNSLATEDEKKNYSDFQCIQLMYMWISIWFTICLYSLLQPFITLWAGEKFILGNTELALFCLYFFCYKLGDICAIYRQAAGLWWQDRFRPITEAFVKTLFNLTVIRYYGISGVLGGSVFCLLIINSIWASWVLYRYYFKSHSQFEYIKRNLFYLFIAILLSGAIGYICSFIPKVGFLNFLYKCLLCLLLPNILIWPLFRILPEYKNSLKLLKRFINA